MNDMKRGVIGTYLAISIHLPKIDKVPPAY